MKKQLLILAMLFALIVLPDSDCVMANNIQLSNVALTGQNTAGGYIMVQFDLSWENSWRTDNLNGDGKTNWDAAWVFVKYRITSENGGDDLWKHAWLNNNGHGGGTGISASIDAGLLVPEDAFHTTDNPALGVFIYRSENGAGHFSVVNALLRWNYASNGVADDATVDIQVFAIEMVYVPEGAFYVGSGGNESGSFTDGSWSSGASIPFQITSEEELTISKSQGNLWGTSSSSWNTIGSTGTLSSSFPKGFASFYCMKYSISQQQYVNFLNTLTRAQQNSRTRTDLAPGVTNVENRYVMSNDASLQHRNGIRCDAEISESDPVTFYCDLNGNGVGGEANDGQWIACNYLSWHDGAAYAAWAGLRPMTELEYEKACRGTANPVANEYAWGTAGVATSPYTLVNEGTKNEGIDEGYNTHSGNAIYGETYEHINGPLRVGIFAAHPSNTGRITAGATYYGIMDMSGNVWERTISVGNDSGRIFTGLHGDGSLTDEGYANTLFWPALGDYETAFGSGFRGGDWDWFGGSMRISDRSFADFSAHFDPPYYGFRLVRTSPHPN